MLLRHIGYEAKATKLEMALDICGLLEKKLVVTGRPTGASGKEYADYIMETLQDRNLEPKWRSYQSN